MKREKKEREKGVKEDAKGGEEQEKEEEGEGKHTHGVLTSSCDDMVSGAP